MTSNDGAAREFQFTSESVTEGHPDKIADQISDVVLDAVLAEDPLGRVACETLITTGLVVVAGEISTHARLDVAKLVRERIRHIGYTRAKYGFDADTCGIMVTLDEQSHDIAQGVDASFEAQQRGAGDPLDSVGAGDPGMMFGYAVAESPELMPLPIVLAHRLAQRLSQVRKDGTLDYLRPDGKTQVTVRCDIDEHGHRTPVEIERVLVSTRHRDGVEAQTQIEPDLIEHVIDPILQADYAHLLDDRRLGDRDFVYVNPTGSFVTGGPMGDTGLTGRKIVVDTYGGAAPHGGGAFSGKDPTKVDRSAAYAARYMAKNIVAAGLAHRCQVQVAYAIGVAQPVSINAECFGTAVVPEARIEELIREHFDLRPAAIVRDLELRRPIYAATAAYGHFGRSDADFTWERTDRADALRAAAGLLRRGDAGGGGMAVTVVGSVAFDSLETPYGRRERILGGAATHFSISASMFTDVRVVGVVGDDFGSDELDRFHAKGIDTTDVERVSGARYFLLGGRYDNDMQVAHTIETQLNVFADFEPKLSDASRNASMVFLANIQPDLQRRVREQCSDARVTGLDSMNYWIESARESLLKTLRASTS